MWYRNTSYPWCQGRLRNENVQTTAIFGKSSGQNKKNYNLNNLGFCMGNCPPTTPLSPKREVTTTTTTTTTNFIENWKITNYISFPPANSL